jgi:hypothetical protein
MPVNLPRYARHKFTFNGISSYSLMSTISLSLQDLLSTLLADQFLLCGGTVVARLGSSLICLSQRSRQLSKQIFLPDE